MHYLKPDAPERIRKIDMMVPVLIVLLTAASSTSQSPLQTARDRQDRAELQKLAGASASSAQKQPDDAKAQYQYALAQSYLAEVAIEQHDKKAAYSAAETGMSAAERAVVLKGDSAEYNRILGTLCGQAISGNGFAALKYGKCAMDSVNKAIELDPKSSEAYVSHGVGSYYLPPAFGGGVDQAIQDFQKAIELDPKSDDAYLWLGVALRKANRNPDARKAFQKSLELNPNRVWAKQQLDKTPAQ